MNKSNESSTYEYKHMRICRRPLHVNRHEYSATTNVGLHFHNAYELLVIESGRYKVYCPDYLYSGSGPCIVLFKLGAYHGILRENCEEEPYRFYVANFYKSVLDFMPEHPICIARSLDEGTIVIPIDNEQLSILIPLMKRLVALSGTYTCESPMPPIMSVYFMTVLGYVYEFISEGKSILFNSESDEEYYISKVIKKTIEAVENGENISVTGLAEAFHVSVTKLSKDFKKVVNIPIKNMIDILRLERSKKLLTAGLSSGEVAEKCGFSGTNYFIQFFKRHMDMSPREYRQMTRQMKD